MVSTTGAEIREHLFYLAIGRDLLCSRYPSGHPFKPNEMCVAYRAGESVRCEALTRLAVRGPVMIRANEGPEADDQSEVIRQIEKVRQHRQRRVDAIRRPCRRSRTAAWKPAQTRSGSRWT